jgi:hypothetical protein
MRHFTQIEHAIGTRPIVFPPEKVPHRGFREPTVLIATLGADYLSVEEVFMQKFKALLVQGNFRNDDGLLDPPSLLSRGAPDGKIETRRVNLNPAGSVVDSRKGILYIEKLKNTPEC